MTHKLSRVMLMLIWLLSFTETARAQTTASALLTSPITDDFPQMSAYLTVYDDQGQFVHGVREQEIVVIEDERRLSLSKITELQPGAQFVLAINLGPSLAIRDVNGTSRFDYLRSALQEWASKQTGYAFDDLSLITSDGIEHIHLDTVEEWLSNLEAYQGDARTAEPNLDVLARAIDTVTDTPPRFGMGRAILLITPPPDQEGITALQSLTSLAIQEGIRVNVWMVSSPAYFASEGADQLFELAYQTQGQPFAYSGIEPIPDFEVYLESLRYIYAIAYESTITTGGSHRVELQINTDQFSVTTPQKTFELDVLPPNPIFISPPLQILRANQAEFKDALEAITDFAPRNQDLEILIEYPDGHSRPLVRTTLYVDGKIASENTSPPFDEFTWNLDVYTRTASHMLQVEAVDTLGLSGLSIETPVQITVQRTPQNFVAVIARNGTLIAGSLVFLAGGILLLVLVIGGRIQPRSVILQRRINGKAKNTDKDPVTQAVGSKRRLPIWKNPLSWAPRRSASKASAFLQPIEGLNHDAGSQEIPINANIITLGREPALVTAAVVDPSVENIHARLERNSEGNYHISDQDSIAGTWVNYAPVPPEGARLEHGDIIHIGRVGFRFIIKDKKDIRKPIIKPQELQS
jgi:hypothetical protein